MNHRCPTDCPVTAPDRCLACDGHWYRGQHSRRDAAWWRDRRCEHCTAGRMSNAQREAWLDAQPITRAEARAMVEAAVAQLRAEIGRSGAPLTPE